MGMHQNAVAGRLSFIAEMRRRQLSYSWEGLHREATIEKQPQAAVIFVLILSAHPANISAHIQRNNKALL